VKKKKQEDIENTILAWYGTDKKQIKEIMKKSPKTKFSPQKDKFSPSKGRMTLGRVLFRSTSDQLRTNIIPEKKEKDDLNTIATKLLENSGKGEKPKEEKLKEEQQKRRKTKRRTAKRR